MLTEGQIKARIEYSEMIIEQYRSNTRTDESFNRLRREIINHRQTEIDTLNWVLEGK